VRSSATAAKLTELIRVCGSCGQALSNHQFALFASVIAGQQEVPRLTAFFQLVRQHEWRSLGKFQEWDGTRDVVQAFAIRCPTGAMQMIALKDFFDPLAANELYLQENLEPTEANVLLTLLPPDKWQGF
jgi:hypothetical protein